jgi:hypothetical protein
MMSTGRRGGVGGVRGRRHGGVHAFGLLVRDPDEAGVQWTAQVGKAINDGGGRLRLATPPGELDPDEAILNGWWPDGL